MQSLQPRWAKSESSLKPQGQENNKAGGRRKLPKLKNPLKVWKNRKQQNHIHTAADESECEGVLQEEQEEEEQLEEVCRRLILREEQLFSQNSPSEADQDQLQQDFEALKVHMCMAVHDTFTSSPGQLEVLRSAIASIQLQEVQDQHWLDCSEDQVPAWRPLQWRSTHNRLLQNLVESRLTKACEEEEEEEEGGFKELSSSVKKQVCRMGMHVKQDLLAVARGVGGCYPPNMDILNLYAGLYHHTFSARLHCLTASTLEPDDCSYLLFWVNHCYPCEVLNHEELQGQVKMACLGSLLPLDHLDQLEQQYLHHKEDKVKLWLNNTLKKEQEDWMSGSTPELLDQHYFSALAIDVIQVMDSILIECRSVIRDQSNTQRITAHLESFLGSYRQSLEELVKENKSNVVPVVKAQLVCEQQLRDYVTEQTESLSSQQRQSCLDSLSALWGCGYRCLTCPLLMQLKVSLRHLWTPVWLDGLVPVVDSVLDAVEQQLGHLVDLKPACRQAVLAALHQDLVLKYVKRMMKMKMRSREQQVSGAHRMMEDAKKLDDFFNEGKSSWLGQMLCSLAEILRLQEVESIHLEMVSLASRFPDLSNAHVSALLALKSHLSAADCRSIRRSVEENRQADVFTNHSVSFFSKVKVQWINQKINQLGL